MLPRCQQRQAWVGRHNLGMSSVHLNTSCRHCKMGDIFGQATPQKQAVMTGAVLLQAQWQYRASAGAMHVPRQCSTTVNTDASRHGLAPAAHQMAWAITALTCRCWAAQTSL